MPTKPEPTGKPTAPRPDAAEEATLPPGAPGQGGALGQKTEMWSGAVPSAQDPFPTLPATFGRYRVERLLGKGGMGAVYLAHDRQLDRPVALKVPSFGGDDPDARQRFLREARAAATVQHANLCPVHDVGEIDGTLFLTMAYLEGRPLADVLRSNRKPLPERQAAALVRKLALALAEAHRKKVIHRDLKPANVMLNPRGEPVIMDFGLARRGGQADPRGRPDAAVTQGVLTAAAAADANLTQFGTVMGTPGYMAPEQAQGNPDAIGPACDIYSLGVILYELLAGRLPFTGDPLSILIQVASDEPKPPSAHRPGLDERLEAICLQAMAKKPSDRHASMTELATALTDFMKTASQPAGKEAESPPSQAELPFAEEPRTEVMPRPRPRRQRPGKRGRALWAGVTLLGAAVVPGLGAWVLLHPKRGQVTEGPVASANALPPAPTQPPPAERITSAPAPVKTPEPKKAAPRPPEPKKAEPKKTEPAPPEPKRPMIPPLEWPAEALQAGTILAPDLRSVKPWLIDNFKNPSSGLPSDSSRGYRNGLYFLHARPRDQVTATLPMGRAMPPNPKGPFACEAIGRVTGLGGRWGLTVLDDGKPRFSVAIHVSGAVTFHKGATAEHRVLDPGKHPAINPKGAKGKGLPNRLLVVVHGRYTEVYVNNRAVCNPIRRVNSIAVPQVALFCAGGLRKAPATAEFESVAVAPADSLPSLESRGARPRSK
jgi:serine/threonine protein kinase